MNIDGNQDYSLPISYKEACNGIDIFFIDLSASSTSTHFNLTIKPSLVPKYYNLELLKNCLVLLQRSEHELSQSDQQRLLKLLTDYLYVKQEGCPYLYMIYASLVAIFAGWILMASLPKLSIILGAAVLSIATVIGVEMLIAISIGSLVGYFIYKSTRYLIQPQLERKLLSAFTMFKDYLDCIDSLVQNDNVQASSNVTQFFFSKKARTRISLTDQVDQTNFISPPLSGNPG